VTTAANTDAKRSWQETLAMLKSPPVWVMLLLGFSAGLPLLLIFSSLSLWLSEAGVQKSTVTLFSWAALGYSFKFVWAPIIDSLPLPVLTARMGRRRSWLLVSQLAIVASIVSMAMINPASDLDALTVMAFAAVALGFSSATQDIVIDAYRIESADKDLQAILASTYIAGYRIAMLVSGALCIVLAQAWGSSAENYSYSAWQAAYLSMAAAMLLGIATTLLMSEPAASNQQRTEHALSSYLRFLLTFAFSVVALIFSYRLSGALASETQQSLTTLWGNKNLASFVVEAVRLSTAIAAAGFTAYLCVALRVSEREMVNSTYVAPVADFFKRYGLGLAALLLAIVGLYRISDIVLGVISNLFYLDLGYSKSEIASAVKTFGLLMSIAGGFAGGLLALRFGVMRTLILGAVLAAATNLLFLLLAQIGYNLPFLYLVVGVDNLCAGLASAAFVAFLSSLTNIAFTAMQYAIFSSLMTLIPKVIGGYSGGIVESVGYSEFFVMTTLMGLPVLLLLVYANNKFDLQLPNSK
jgi:PAT family beta-lactamase induction signal transducer AmpG